LKFSASKVLTTRGGKDAYKFGEAVTVEREGAPPGGGPTVKAGLGTYPYLPSHPGRGLAR